MNLNQLHYFVTLAHVQHYTKAAEKLSITQPTLSHAIASLEEELGTFLFEKQGRNITLTKYGQMFLEYAQEALGILETGVKKTKSMTSKNSGRIELGYIYTQGSGLVPELVAGFLKKYPEKTVDFGFYNGVTEEVLQGLREERYDVGFCSWKDKQKDLEFVPVAEEKLVAIVPLDHPLAKEKKVKVQDFLQYPQIWFNQGSGLRQYMDKICKHEKIHPEVVFCADEDTALAGLVAQGFGVAIVPDIPAIRSMKVACLEIEGLSYQRRIYMVTRKDVYQIPVLKSFIEYAKQVAKKA